MNPYDAPLLNNAATAALAKFGGSFATSVAESLAGPLLAMITRETTAFFNTVGRAAVPPPHELVNLWWCGQLHADTARRLMNMNGVAWTPDAGGPGNRERDAAWWNIFDLKRPQWGLDSYLRWWRLGMISEGVLDDALSRAGFNNDTDVQYGSNVRNVKLFKQDFLPPPLQDIILMYWRGIVNEEWFRKYLTMHGFWKPGQQDDYLELTKNIPGPSDLVRFAVRHVFEPDIVKELGFNDEISKDFLDWHEKQGFGWKFDIKHEKFGEWKDATWAQAFWWAHWVWPAPTQLYEFYQRARPLPDDPTKSRLAGLPPFTFDKLKLGLRGNDYPPAFRDYLAAISFRPPTRYDAQYAYQQQQIDFAELKERLRDVGYNEGDAGLIGGTIRRRTEYRRFSSLLGRMAFQARNAFRDGLMTRDQAGPILQLSTFQSAHEMDVWSLRTPADRIYLAKQDRLVQTALDVLEAIPGKAARVAAAWKGKGEQQLAKCTQDAYDLGVIDKATATGNLKALGIATTDIATVLDSIDLCHTTKLVRESIRVIRSAFLKGQTDEAGTRARLTAAGIVQDRADQYLTLWKIQLTPTRRRLATAQVLSLVRAGELPPADAQQQLDNLGWVNADALLLTAQADASFQKSLVRQQRAESSRLPLPEMKRLVKEGYLPPGPLAETMAAKGYPQAVIDAELHYLLTPRVRKSRTPAATEAKAAP